MSMHIGSSFLGKQKFRGFLEGICRPAAFNGTKWSESGAEHKFSPGKIDWQIAIAPRQS
jgi:hypothetical protein